MQEILYFVLFGLGLLMIIKGSDWFIDAVLWFAEVMHIPQLIIGATIVSICTTMPETFVSVTAALKAETDTAFGNAVGSIATNTGLIMAILIIFAAPVIENMRSYCQNGISLMIALLFMWGLGFASGQISRPIGLLLLVGLVVYIANNLRSAKAEAGMVITSAEIAETAAEAAAESHLTGDAAQGSADERSLLVHNALFFVVGLALVIVGSNLLVDNGIAIADLLGVPSLLVAVIFTSFGTSLPELMTTITSIRKKAGNLGVGNIIGADILNILQVVSLSATVHPIDMTGDRSIQVFQMPITIAIVGFAVVTGMRSEKGFRKWQGFVLLALYIVFLCVNLLRENTPILGPLLFS